MALRAVPLCAGEAPDVSLKGIDWLTCRCQSSSKDLATTYKIWTPKVPTGVSSGGVSVLLAGYGPVGGE